MDNSFLLGVILAGVVAIFLLTLVGFSERTRMARSIQEALAGLDTQLSGLKTRVAEDTAELKRIIEAQGGASAELQAAVARIDATSAELQSIDPVSEFPAPAPDPEPTPDPTPVPDGGTTPDPADPEAPTA